MKCLRTPTLVVAALLIALTLHAAGDDDDHGSPSPGHARTHRKHAADAAASPAPSPGKRHDPGPPANSKDGDSPTASPEPKPSSADEAAPSKAPPAAGSGSPAKNAAGPAAVSTIDPAEIEGFDAQPEPIRKLLTAALDLTKKNLTYTYGSTDPASGGLDCSGTIYYLLRQAGFEDVPRDASEQYEWVRQKSHFYAVLSKKQDNAELRELRPGDLMFWTGTYHVDRDPPVTHTMIYLGKRKKDGRRLMIGSSDGRPYDGQRRNGVSVFDFKMPAARSGDAADAATAAAPDNAPDFSGYGPAPGMSNLSDIASRQTAAANSKDSSADAAPAPTPKKSRHAHAASE